MKKVIFIVLTIHLAYYAFGQEDAKTYSSWYAKIAGGFNIPTTNLFSGKITDPLIEYCDDNSFYLQFSGGLFISPNWGLATLFKLNYNNDVSGFSRTNRFNTSIQDKYEEDYFVTSGTGIGYDEASVFDYPRADVYIGILYRIEKPKFIFSPKLLLGVTSLNTNWGSAELKAKDSHTILKVTYDTEDLAKDYFSAASAIAFGYRLSKRMIVNFDIQYAYFKANIEFTEEIHNTFTEEISLQTIEYNKNIQTLSIGLGLIVELGYVDNN